MTTVDVYLSTAVILRYKRQYMCIVDLGLAFI